MKQRKPTTKFIPASHKCTQFTCWGMPYIDKIRLISLQIRQCETCGLIEERQIGSFRVVSAWTDLNTRTIH